jgi:hypothetical protein
MFWHRQIRLEKFFLVFAHVSNKLLVEVGKLPRWLKTPVDGQQTDKRQTKFVQEFVEEKTKKIWHLPASKLIAFFKSLGCLNSNITVFLYAPLILKKLWNI